VRKVTNASDGQGGQTETWADRATNVPCRLTRALTRGETPQGERVVHLGSYKLALPYSQTVEPTDKIIHSDGRTYNVIEVESGVRACQHVWLELIE
jgi:hypothetical protein